MHVCFSRRQRRLSLSLLSSVFSSEPEEKENRRNRRGQREKKEEEEPPYHNGVDDDERPLTSFLTPSNKHRLDRPFDRGERLGPPDIARQDEIVPSPASAGREKPVPLQAAQQLLEPLGRQPRARDGRVAGVVREAHRVDGVAVEAVQREREKGGAVSHAARGDVGLDGEDAREPLEVVRRRRGWRRGRRRRCVGVGVGGVVRRHCLFLSNRSLSRLLLFSPFSVRSESC